MANGSSGFIFNLLKTVQILMKFQLVERQPMLQYCALYSLEHLTFWGDNNLDRILTYKNLEKFIQHENLVNSFRQFESIGILLKFYILLQM